MLGTPKEARSGERRVQAKLAAAPSVQHRPSVGPSAPPFSYPAARHQAGISYRLAHASRHPQARRASRYHVNLLTSNKLIEIRLRPMGGFPTSVSSVLSVVKK